MCMSSEVILILFFFVCLFIHSMFPFEQNVNYGLMTGQKKIVDFQTYANVTTIQLTELDTYRTYTTANKKNFSRLHDQNE